MTKVIEPGCFCRPAAAPWLTLPRKRRAPPPQDRARRTAAASVMRFGCDWKKIREMAKAGKMRRTLSRKSRAGVGKRPTRRTRRPFVIDFHAHVIVPEVRAFSEGHVVDVGVPPDPDIPEAAKRAWLAWREQLKRKTFEVPARLAEMDKMGVDLQVLTPSLVHQYTYWADPETSLRLERLTNDRIAEIVAHKPDRFAGIGGVPLQAPELAIAEMRRCMGELGFRGVEVSSHAHTMELGDARLRPFWAAAEKLGAVIYLHPAGTLDPRYRRHQLWNSIGQPLEEALAMSSLFYEGVLDAHPKLKLCIAHGGGYLPYYSGRMDRNYREKQFTRTHMTKSPSDYMREHFWYDSCLYNVDVLAFLVRKVGASRVVMGSDYPVGEHDPVGFVKSARLPAADEAAILGRNAARLLGLSL